MLRTLRMAGRWELPVSQMTSIPRRLPLSRQIYTQSANRLPLVNAAPTRGRRVFLRRSVIVVTSLFAIYGVYSAGRSALAYRSLNQISPFIALIQYGRLQRLLSRDFIADDIEEAMDQLLEVLDCIEYFLQKRETPGSLEEQLGLSNKLRTAAFCCKYLNPDLSAEALSLIKKAFVDLHSVKLYKWPIEAGTITENIDGASKGRSVQEVSLILMRHLDRIGSFVVNAREGRTLGKLNGDVTVIEVPEAQNAKSNEWTSID